MKYLCLAYEEESILSEMPEKEWEKLRKETLEYVESLQRSGKLFSAEPLQSVRNAISVRVRDQKLMATDGPFAETKEQLGGFFLIDAINMEEAVKIASRWPSARFGTIEVRPIQDALKPGNRYS
jgi:hypothetical protein